MRRGILIVAAVALLAPAPAARAADPARWIETGVHQIPFEYFQGMTSDPQRNLYFDGFFFGLYRTTPTLQETARNPFAIPPEVLFEGEGYNHIGDITWDAAEGGRILLPLECFVPGGPNGGNTCGRGGIGVADPDTVTWRYHVNLDPADIPKVMWAEVSPDGSLLWTSAGADLLAYSVADVSPANAAPDGPLLRPVRRLTGAVPPSGITGATFYEGRLFLAGQNAGPFQVWSVDLETGERRLEIERTISGESEGLDVVDALGGVLHWMIQPVTRRPPATYPYSVILSFIPANRAPDCSLVRADPSSLWPPNHKLRAVLLSGATDPDGDAVSIAVTRVTHDEAAGGGAADHATGASPDQVLLRAERSGRGDGRSYTVEFQALDQKGGQCTGAVTVTVPHDARGRLSR